MSVMDIYSALIHLFSLAYPLFGMDINLMFPSAQIRPDRQTLYWSATWPKEVEQLARQFLYNPYKVRYVTTLVVFNGQL